LDVAPSNLGHLSIPFLLPPQDPIRIANAPISSFSFSFDRADVVRAGLSRIESQQNKIRSLIMSQVESRPKFACPICEARANLADAIAAEVKAASEAHHLATHWRTAHDQREASNFEAENRTADSIGQFDHDTAEEERWYINYQNALVALNAASQVSAEARELYHSRLKVYTDQRVPKKSCCGGS
jgi:hypothetical protein